MKPFQTLLVLLIVAVLCVAIMLFFPKSGIRISDSITLKFKSWSDLTDTISSKPVMENVETFLAAQDSVMDTLQVNRQQSITSLQFADGNSASLFPFFESLERAAQGERIHVLHYGDSQIESDRMTSLLRSKWQEMFGGSGPGLITPVPITASAAISQSCSPNFKRYTAYGFDDGKINHNQFGVMASFGRFTSPLEASQINPSDTAVGWLEFRPSGMSSASCRKFSKATMWFGHHKFPVEVELWLSDSLLDKSVFQPTQEVIERTWRFGGLASKVRWVFKGPDSPDIQAISFEGASGVLVDNIALRGSSGTIFKKINASELGQQMTSLNATLILLQFGGNSAPYTSSVTQANDYGSFFQSQIQQLKRLNPKASFIVIGPSDMSTSVDGVYQTWPYLEAIRDAMKKAAFNEGCAFWDMYSVMGGRNSMISWVANNPPYAGPDYTHFTPLGARRVAELLFKSIQKEYDAWKTAKSSL